VTEVKLWKLSVGCGAGSVAIGAFLIWLSGIRTRYGFFGSGIVLFIAGAIFGVIAYVAHKQNLDAW
jgi:hypothetical protein